MKKQLSVLLAAALLLTLTACKKADADPQPRVDPPVSEEPETPAEAEPFGQTFDAAPEPDDPISRFPDLSALYGMQAQEEEPAAEEPEEEPTRTFVPGQTRPAAPQPETPSASSVFEGFEGIKFSD